MMCQSIGRSPIRTIGFGMNSVSSLRRVPRPPHKMATGMSAWDMRGGAFLAFTQAYSSQNELTSRSRGPAFLEFLALLTLYVPADEHMVDFELKGMC